MDPQQPPPWLGSEDKWVAQHVVDHGFWVGRKRFDVHGMREHVDALVHDPRAKWEGVVRNWVQAPDGQMVSDGTEKRSMLTVDAEVRKKTWGYLWYLQVRQGQHNVICMPWPPLQHTVFFCRAFMENAGILTEGRNEMGLTFLHSKPGAPSSVFTPPSTIQNQNSCPPGDPQQMFHWDYLLRLCKDNEDEYLPSAWHRARSHVGRVKGSRIPMRCTPPPKLVFCSPLPLFPLCAPLAVLWWPMRTTPSSGSATTKVRTRLSVQPLGSANPSSSAISSP